MESNKERELGRRKQRAAQAKGQKGKRRSWNGHGRVVIIRVPNSHSSACTQARSVPDCAPDPPVCLTSTGQECAKRWCPSTPAYFPWQDRGRRRQRPMAACQSHRRPLKQPGALRGDMFHKTNCGAQKARQASTTTARCRRKRKNNETGRRWQP